MAFKPIHEINKGDLVIVVKLIEKTPGRLFKETENKVAKFIGKQGKVVRKDSAAGTQFYRVENGRDYCWATRQEIAKANGI